MRRATFLYPDERPVLERHEIVEETRTRVMYVWCQYFDPDEVRAELADAGLILEEMLGSVAVDPFDPESPEFAVVAGPELKG